MSWTALNMGSHRAPRQGLRGEPIVATLTTMDMNLARTFVSVVDAGSLTAAARATSLPKSSVSRALARLESDLGARLVDRSTRHLTITPAGRAYYDGAKAALA